MTHITEEQIARLKLAIYNISKGDFDATDDEVRQIALALQPSASAEPVQECVMCHGKGWHWMPWADLAGVEPPPPKKVACTQCSASPPPVTAARELPEGFRPMTVEEFANGGQHEASATGAEPVDAARVRALEEAAQLHGLGDVAAPIGNSAWGEAYQEGWIAGTQAYRDAILALQEKKK
jgi:hypothetical protein